jgi:hypothetical protein
MARTIAVIKAEITTSFMSNETLASAYGFTSGASFTSVFSSVSIESILCYIVAAAIWTLEKLFDTHASEMSDLIDTKKPHRLKWYRDKALSFMFGYSLEEDSDTYDTTDLTDDEITAAEVVKYASAIEYQGKLYIKVAGAGPAVLTTAQKTALEAYFAEIKDAGVVLEVVNKAADHFALSLTIYYDPMVIGSDGLRLDTGEATILNTIKDFVQTQIPFNGEYRNSSLVDALQKLDGVVIPELSSAKTVSADDYDTATASSEDIPWETISAKCIPASGYFKVYNDSDVVLTFKAYQTIESV